MQTRPFKITLAACAMAALGATGASADCAEELAALTEGGSEGGISKDGSLAPLEDEASAGDAAAAEGSETDETAGDGEIAKDGSTAPLESESGEGADVATSRQEAQDQQQSDQQEMASGGDTGRADALARAQEALSQGDEAGCIEAVEEARQM